MTSNNSTTKKMLLISAGCILAIGALVSGLLLFNAQKIKNKEIVELTTISNSKLIKEILGENYENGIYERDKTKTETYSTITIGNVDVNFATLKYNENVEYEALLIGVSSKKEDVDILADDFIKHYGKDYSYQASKDGLSYNYRWEIDSTRTLNIDIMNTGIGHVPYSVSITSYHQ